MFNYIVYRIGEFIALSLPLPLSYGLAVFISELHYLFSFRDRRSVKANLRVIFPEKSEKEIKKITEAMFRNFAKYLVDFFRFSQMDIEYIKRNIEVKNIHYIDEALKLGRGVIILSAHIGNWELGAVVVALSGYKFSVVALPHKYEKVDKFFNQQRQSKGVKVIPLGRAVKQCLIVLKENEVLALAGDRDFSERGEIADFFGKPTYFPPGPAAFALKAGAVIVPGFMFRNPDDTFTLKFDKPLTYNSDKHKNVVEVISSYKGILEDYIHKYPEQWYMFRQFWK